MWNVPNPMGVLKAMLTCIFLATSCKWKSRRCFSVISLHVQSFFISFNQSFECRDKKNCEVVLLKGICRGKKV